MRVLMVAALAVVASGAQAAWRYGGQLSDDFAGNASGRAYGAGVFYGGCNVGLSSIAVTWTGATGPAVARVRDLRETIFFGASGGTGVGLLRTNGLYRAGLWRARTGWVDLQPNNATDSVASGTDGALQVGQATLNSFARSRAVVWQGTADSMVVLNSPTDRPAYARGVLGDVVVGYIGSSFITNFRAAEWSFASRQITLRHPNTATTSAILAVSAGATPGTYEMGGWAYHQGIQKATLWRGARFTYLARADHTDSTVNGVAPGHQVGYAAIGQQVRAFAWRGSAATATDLHALLPPGFESSTAYSVQRYLGNTLVAVGTAYPARGSAAVFWIYTP